MKNSLGLNSNQQNSIKKKSIQQSMEFTPEEVVKILEQEQLFINIDSNKVVQKSDLEEWIVKLYENWNIDFDQMLKISVKIWTIRIWEYLIFKWLINNEQLKEAIEEQEKNLNKNLWEIFIEKWFLKEDNLYKELHTLWIIKFWEYLLYKWDINKETLSKALKDKTEEITIWEFLLKKWIISIKILIKRLEELWIIKLWEILIKKWILNKNELNLYLNEQKYTWKKLWEILIENWELKRWELNSILFTLFKNIDWCNLSSMIYDRIKLKKQRKEKEKNCKWRNAK